MSQNGQTHFKILAGFVTVWLWLTNVRHPLRVKTRKELGVCKSCMKLSDLNIHNFVESEIFKFKLLRHWHLNELYTFFESTILALNLE